MFLSLQCFILFTVFPGMKYKLEAKDMDIKELKKMVKMKQEELSEMQASLSYWLT
jgi:hypothetical protein